jgi:formate dehydrogenase maturation protein FdhE
VSDALYVCPECGSTDVPKLVMRGSGRLGESGLSMRCRVCDSEWPDGHAGSRAS